MRLETLLLKNAKDRLKGYEEVKKWYEEHFKTCDYGYDIIKGLIKQEKERIKLIEKRKTAKKADIKKRG
jgi:hypothetical protein